MSSVAFLLLAIGLSVVGSALFVLGHRKPTSLEHGVDTFRAEMRALAPGRAVVAPRPRTTRSSGSSRRPRGRARR